MDLKKNMDLATLKDVLSLKMGSTVAKQIRKKVPDGRVAHRCWTISSNMSARRPTTRRRCCARSGICRPMAASGTRWAAPAPCRWHWRSWRRSWAWRRGWSTGIRRIVSDRGAVSAVETDSGRDRAACRPSSPTWIACGPTASWSAASRRRRSTSGGSGSRPAPAWCLYLGLDRAYDHLLHHDFVFSRDPEEEFDWIYNKGEPAPDPTCYIAAPARTEPGVAPPGGEALYVLVHTPYLRPHHDWTAMLPKYRKVILDKLARCAGMPDLEEPHRVRASPDPGRHPRALPRAERRHLRAGQPRQVFRCVQTGQPFARPCRAVSGRGGRRIPARACRWC